MSERNGIAHLRGDKSHTALCGASTYMRFVLVDLEHAEACVTNNTRIQPCKHCLRIARNAVVRL